MMGHVDFEINFSVGFLWSYLAVKGYLLSVLENRCATGDKIENQIDNKLR